MKRTTCAALLLTVLVIVPCVGQETPKPNAPDVNKALDRVEFPTYTDYIRVMEFLSGIMGFDTSDFLRDATPTGTPEDEVKAAQQLCRSRPNDPEAHYRLGVAYSRAQQSKEARAAFQESADLYRKLLGQKPKDAALWWRLGLALIGAEPWDAKPVSVDFTKLRANLLAPQRTKLKAAEEAFQKSLKLNPQFAKAYAGLALVEKERGDYDKAKEWMERASSVNPREAYVYAVQPSTVDVFEWMLGLSALLKPKGDPWKAARIFHVPSLQKAVELAPDNLLYRQRLGTSLAIAGAVSIETIPDGRAAPPSADEMQIFRQAAQHLALVQQRRPDVMPEVYALLGTSLSRSGKMEEAVRIFDEGIKRYPLSSEIAFSFANSFVRQGENGRARIVIEEKQKRKAEPVDHNYLAYLAYLNKEWDKAEEEQVKALSKGVGMNEFEWKVFSSAVYLGRVLIALRKGNVEQATTELTKVETPVPSEPTHNLVQGIVESLKGNQQEASNHFYWALCDNPNDADAQAVVREFMGETGYQSHLQQAKDYKKEQDEKSARDIGTLSYLRMLCEVWTLIEANNTKVAEQRVIEKVGKWKEGFEKLATMVEEWSEKEENEQAVKGFTKSLRFVAEVFKRRFKDESLLEVAKRLDEDG